MKSLRRLKTSRLFFLSLLGLSIWTASARAAEGYRVVGNDGLTVVVNSSGNLDGDSVPDLGVGVPEESGTGAIYIFLGKNLLNDMTLDLAVADFVIEGGTDDDRAGSFVDFIPDEDGDGFDEVLISFGDGSDPETVFSNGLDDFATGGLKGPLLNSTSVGVSVGVGRNIDCSLNARASRAGCSSAFVSALAVATLAGLFFARKATTRR